MKRNDSIDALGLEKFNALLPGFVAVGQGGNNQDLCHQSRAAKLPGSLLKNPRLNEPENLRRIGQHGGAEGFRVPSLHHHHGPDDRRQIERRQDERQRSIQRGWLRIQDKEIDLLIIATGRGDIFALLADEKSVQFKILTNDGFTDGGHGDGCSLRFGIAAKTVCSGFVQSTRQEPFVPT